MEQFKLDLSKLTPVAEANRIMGNYYIACDDIETKQPVITRWHSGNNQIFDGRKGVYWKHWLQIPPGLPGFPVAELPDEFELKKGEWLDASGIMLAYNQTFKRKPVALPEISIPSGTKSEQIEAVKKILEQLETK